MAYSNGDLYRCPDNDCGCEVTVTKAAQPSCPDAEELTCCGKVMVRAD